MLASSRGNDVRGRGHGCLFTATRSSVRQHGDLWAGATQRSVASGDRRPVTGCGLSCWQHRLWRDRDDDRPFRDGLDDAPRPWDIKREGLHKKLRDFTADTVSRARDECLDVSR